MPTFFGPTFKILVYLFYGVIKNFLHFVTGGPFVMKESQDRYVLVGTLHGSYVDCSNQWPTIYTRIDDFSVLQFLRKIVFNETIADSGKFEFYYKI